MLTGLNSTKLDVFWCQTLKNISKVLCVKKKQACFDQKGQLSEFSLNQKDVFLIMSVFSMGLDIMIHYFISMKYAWQAKQRIFYTFLSVLLFLWKHQTNHVHLFNQEGKSPRLSLSLTCQLSQDPRGFNHPHINFQSTKMLDLQIKEDKCKHSLK